MMKKFVKKLILFVLVIMICISAIVSFDYFIIGSQFEYSYPAALIDKVERLEKIDTPKIILVGNSNLAFGIKSKIIEEEVGMPVVNLGLHGGLGNAFHEQIAKLNINEGDIVVICHTSFSDNDELENASLAWQTYDYHEPLRPIIREKDYKSMLISYPDYLEKAYLLWLTRQGNKDNGTSYSRNAFNEYGDVVYKPESSQMEPEVFFANNPIYISDINNTCINRLNEFHKYVNQLGAKMVIAGYPIAYGQYANFTKEDVEVFQLQLKTAVSCDVISDYTDYLYPYSYFYDTIFHLTDEGAEIRTYQLCEDLKEWMRGTVEN